MNGILDFDSQLINEEFKGIKRQMSTMQGKITKALKEFIKQMPEYKDIDPADKTKQDNFWKSIAEDGKKPTTDDLIEYVAKNYSVNLEGKAGELQQKMEAARESCLKTVTESAKSLITRQNDIIKENDRIIQEKEAELFQTREALKKARKSEQSLKTQYTNETDPDKKAEAQKQWDACTDKIVSLEDKEKSLTEGDNSIEANKKQQVDFKKANNKIKTELRELLAKHNISLDNQQPGQQQPGQQSAQKGSPAQGNNTVQQQAYYGDAGEYAQEPEDFSRYTSLQPVEYAPVNNRRTANQLIDNLRNSPDKNRMLDGMGYGDILAASKKAGILRRIQLRKMILNRAEEAGVDEKDINKIISKDKIIEMEEKMAKYDTMTPQDRAEFDAAMRTIKYGTLLRETDRVPVISKFVKIFSRDDERTNHAGALLEKYSDKKSETNTARFDMLNRLRASVGKQEVPRGQEFENARGKAGKDARMVPTTGDEGR